MSDKCIVKGCTNRKGQGNFNGEICSPCYIMLEEGRIGPTTAWFAVEITNLRDCIENAKDALNDF